LPKTLLVQTISSERSKNLRAFENQILNFWLIGESYLFSERRFFVYPKRLSK
jgi:hypothetical protein